MDLLPTILLLAFGALAPVQPQDGRAMDRSTPVESLVMESPKGMERFVFRLDAPRRASGEPLLETDRAPLGWARLSKGAPDRSGSVRTTLELTFAGQSARVIHGETISRLQRDLSWRELDGPRGRSLFLRSRAGQVQVRDYAVDGAERVVEKSGALDRLPLELVDLALKTQRPVEADRFDPLSRTWTRVRASSGPMLDGHGPLASLLRQVRIEEPDGRVTRWIFLGAEPIAFELSPGGPVATRAADGRFPTRWLPAEATASRD